MERHEPDYMDLNDELEFCKHCEAEVKIIKRDFGIGAYEYWGSKGVHRDMRDCCSQCEEEL